MLQLALRGHRLHVATTFWAILSGVMLHADAQCTMPSALVGDWYLSSKAKVISITSAGVSGYDVQAGSNTVSSFSCYSTSGTTYVFGLPSAVTGVGGNVYGHFCWQFVKETDTTYLLYQLTEISGGGTFMNERIVETLDGRPLPSADETCQLTSTTEAPAILYQVSSGSSDVNLATISQTQQQCPSEVFHTYSYVKDSSGCSGSPSELDFCVDRMTARINYTLCATKILFSQDGLLSCIASVRNGSDVYVLLINHDSSVDGTTYHRFACMKVTRGRGTVSATAYPGYCGATSGTEQLTLTTTNSCPIVKPKRDNVPLIVGVVVGVLALIAIIVAAVVIYKKVYLKRKRNIVTPTKPTRNGHTLHKTDAPPDSSQPEVVVNHSESDHEIVPSVTRLPPLENNAETLPPLRT